MAYGVLNYSAIFLPNIGGIERHIHDCALHSRMRHSVLTDMLPGTEEVEDYGHITAYRTPPVRRLFRMRQNHTSFVIGEVMRERRNSRQMADLVAGILDDVSAGIR